MTEEKVKAHGKRQAEKDFPREVDTAKKANARNFKKEWLRQRRVPGKA